VVGGKEADVLADDGPLPVVGGQHAVAGDGGEALHIGVVGVEEELAVLVVLHAHAEMVEKLGEGLLEERIGIRGADAVENARGGPGVEGVELKQAVAAAFQLRGEGGAELCGLGDQGFEGGGGENLRFEI
jgi:hypothetical protein